MSRRVDEIKKFWDDRAKEFGEDWRATLGEKYLRLLEIKTMTGLIKSYRPGRVLDVGCGNGYSTKLYANSFPNIEFIGIDYSEKMIQQANKSPVKNCNFVIGDVLNTNLLPEGVFDLIITQRCLQNLTDYESQQQAINNLISKKSIHGALLLMECSKDGVEQLNRFRTKMGLKPFENIEPWHNNFFHDNKLRKDFNADIVYFTSTYMFLVKLITIHPWVSLFLSVLGYHLPQFGKFGYDRLYIIK